MRILPLLLGASLFSLALCASPLGNAGDFNLFVLGNATLSNTDVQGRVAVGGDAAFSNFGIGSNLTADATRLDLIVGGTLNYQNGQIFSGSGVYGVAGTISGVGLPTAGSTLSQGASPIDFAAEAVALVSLSNLWNSLGGTQVDPVAGQLVINANSPGLNVFRIAGFSGLNTVTINVAAGATVLINVDAASDSMLSAGMTVNGDVQSVLFNYYQGTALSLDGFGLRGSLLAPLAAFSFNNGNIDGNVIVASISGNGESHNLLFNGEVPTVPEPATWALAGCGLLLFTARFRLKRHSPR
jgi:choice-of-anchor A domain-containing protein